VTGKILTLDRVLEPALPALLSLLHVPVDDPQWAALDPSQRRQRTLDAVKRLPLREAQVQPVLVVFEDLHWIDSETQALLHSLIESLPTSRMLLLINYRPEYSHAWGGKTYYIQLRLDTLPPESTDELLDALLGRDSSLQPLKTLLARNTAGNPLFLEESVRMVTETKALVGERGAYRLVRPVQTVQVPTTVQTILAARIDRLPPEEKRLLETAAVIGKDFAFTLLQAIADETDRTLRSRLDHLQAAEFLYEASLFPDLEYTFKHALTHEVAYGSLLRERRLLLHAQIVEAIERLHADRLAEHVERLAYHALRAQMWDKAARYFREAGIKAAARWTHREAVSCFDQALVALGHVPEDEGTRELAIDLRFELRNSLQPLGEFQRVATHLQEAEALAEALGDQRRIGRAVALQANHFSLSGDHDRAWAAGQRATVIAAALDDVSLQFQANMCLGVALTDMGQYRQSREYFERNHTLLQRFPAEERFGLAGVARVLNAHRWYWAWPRPVTSMRAWREPLRLSVWPRLSITSTAGRMDTVALDAFTYDAVTFRPLSRFLSAA
jgi:predicted ATPase